MADAVTPDGSAGEPRDDADRHADALTSGLYGSMFIRDADEWLTADGQVLSDAALLERLCELPAGAGICVLASMDVE